MPARDFLGEFSEYIRNSSEIIRILNSGEVDNIALPDAERKRFEYLFLGKRSLDHSVGYIEGERIVITMGPLKGREGQIKHINRHNRMAIIELSVFEQSLCVKIALEIIEKNLLGALYNDFICLGSLVIYSAFSIFLSDSNKKVSV